jgi:glycosyltransferase involved in cell wall biosynthesis
MRTPDRSVLHVLPHPGGGGETYVDLLEGMPGYRFTRVYVAPSAKPSPLELARGLVGVFRRARGHDLVHVHGEVAAGLSLPLLAAFPSVVTLHGLNLARRVNGGLHTAAAANLRAVVKAADRTICVCDAEQTYLASVVGAALAAEALVVRNGVRLPPSPSRAVRSEVRGELGISDSDLVTIWVGALDVPKDPLAAVRASQEASVTLVMVGSGSLRPAVEAIAGGSTHLLGHRSDVPRLLAAADIFMFLTHREGLAFTLLEAMAHGLPSVVTALPENLEAVGEAGLSVPTGDHTALVASIRRLADDTAARASLGRRARKRVAALFDADAMTDNTRLVYDEVLAKGPKMLARLRRRQRFDYRSRARRPDRSKAAAGD